MTANVKQVLQDHINLRHNQDCPVDPQEILEIVREHGVPTLTPEQRKLMAADIATAPILRKCLQDALAELEIAMGFRDWKGVRRAIVAIREALQQ